MAVRMPRQPEPEFMNIRVEVQVYARARFAEVNAAFVERLMELAGACRKARALDLGTGPGNIPVRVVRARPAWRITAVDGSGTMLHYAQRAVTKAGLIGPIGLIQTDAKLLPLRSRVFDVVFSNSILHHVSDVHQFWLEVKRVARPGAVVLHRDLARPASAATARQIVEDHAGRESPLLRAEFYRSLLAAYRPGEVRRQLQQAGLSGLRVAMVSDRHLDVFGVLPAS